MRKVAILTFCILNALFFTSHSLYAIKPKSKNFKSEDEATDYLVKHYNFGCQYFNCEEWSKAASEFEKVIFYFPCSDAAATASYYLAVSYFEMKEYDFANEEFSNYLKASQHPNFFEEAVEFKFCIAEHFKGGKKRRPFKMRYLPKWISGQDSALVIYDEVVAALPNHELTVQALYSKANLLMQMGEYRDAIEAYQTIIRRFSKHEIVPCCYLKISEAYVRQSELEFQNPDILALAELNVRKFSNDFPRDERVAIAEQSVRHIKEMYAKGLCDLGLFYERLQKPDAAAIYFQSSIEEFPDTQVARFCRSRLICLGYVEEEASSPPGAAMEDVQSPLEKCVSDNRELSNDAEVLQLPQSDEVEAPQDQCPHLESYVAATQCDIPPQEAEFVHYGLTKREVKQAPRPPENARCQQQTSNLDRGIEPSPSPVCQEEAYPAEKPLELWHYSVIKNREQNVPCQN
jgi:outer membrane protein assembly factor BamD (BamD/ComL family)